MNNIAEANSIVKVFVFVGVILILFLPKEINSKRKSATGIFNFSRSGISLDDIKCTNLDETFVQVVECKEETIPPERFFSLHANLLKSPVTQSAICLQIFEVNNNKVPLLNQTIDVCSFFASRNNYLFNAIFKVIDKYTNINHTCPYSDNLIIKKLPLTKISFPMFSVGKYRMQLLVMAYNIPRVSVSASITRKK